jgi:hypothetical protein
VDIHEVDDGLRRRSSPTFPSTARPGRWTSAEPRRRDYGFPAELEFLRFFLGALKAVAPEFPGLPDDPPPLEFQVSDPEVLRRRLTDAGLKDVRVEHTAERPTFSSWQEMWDWVLYGNPIPGMVIADLGLTEEQQATLRQILDGVLRERAGRDGRVRLTNRVNIGIGTN